MCFCNICDLLFPLRHFLFFGTYLSNVVIKVLSNSSYEFLQPEKASPRSSLKFTKKFVYSL